MFSEEQITKIFSNIEQIYLFHQEILKQLEECFVEDDPYVSEIGHVFLNNVSFIAIIELRREGEGRQGGRNADVRGVRSLTGGGKRGTAIAIFEGAQKIHITTKYFASRRDHRGLNGDQGKILREAKSSDPVATSRHARP